MSTVSVTAPATPAQVPKRSKAAWAALIGLLLAMLLLGALLARGLTLNPRDLPSALVGKPVPLAALQALPVVGLGSTQAQSSPPPQLAGRVWVLNVWASWCVSCREEHALLLQAAQDTLAPLNVPLVGLDYKDKPDDAAAFLRQHGNPFAVSFADAAGRVGIELGVYGVPETFVVDAHGIVRHRSTGPLTPQHWNQVIAPLVNDLTRSQPRGVS